MIKKLPFGIDFVVEQDLVPLGIQKVPNSTGYSFNCPFCEKNGLKPDRKHKYSVDIYKNVGHCMRCGSGHGILSLHQALSKNPISMDESKQDLLKRWNGLPSDVQVTLSKTLEHLEEENRKQLEPAPIEIRDEVYRRFLNNLTLSSRHRQDLLSRGLTEKEIDERMYRTVPSVGAVSFGVETFTYEISDTLKRHTKWGIPGFYDIRTSEPKVVFCDPGFFVPVRDEFNRISGMQIRYDPLPENASEAKKDHYAKYKWFNSNFREKKDGCTASGCENIHYATPLLSVPKSIILTEGVLKADIISRLGGRLKGKEPVPVIGVVGVYNTENLCFELLKMKQYGLETVYIAVDMDYREKKQVADALNNIEEIVSGTGLKYKVETWNPAYKGYDDYLLGVQKYRAGGR